MHSAGILVVMNADRLRVVLRLNAVNSAVCGLALLVGAEGFADWLGSGHPGWIRLVGAGLLPFAALLVWTAAGDVDRLRSETPAIVAGDLGWVIASVVALVLGWFSGAGVALVVAMALIVDTFAVLQWHSWRRLGSAS